MTVEDPEVSGWDGVEDLARRGSSTSSVEAQTQMAKKLAFAIANLRLAVNSHQKITGTRLENLTKSIDEFNKSSGRLSKAANGLALALVVLAAAKVLVAWLHK